MNNIGFSQPDESNASDSSNLVNADGSVHQTSPSPSLQSMSKSSLLIENQLSVIPGLVPPQALRLQETDRAQVLDNTLSSTIEVFEQTLQLLSDEQVGSQLFRTEQADVKTSLTQFMSVILKATQELKEIQRVIGSDYVARSQALKMALSNLYELETPGENISKLLLMTELIRLKNSIKNISTGKRIILGEHPEIMLKLLEYGIIPPTVTGGPFDGMARKYVTENRPPYDNLSYAIMAESLPPGWEELSESELDSVISELQDSMSPPLSTTSSALLSTVASNSLTSVANIFDAVLGHLPNFMQMLALRMQLENLKKTDREGDYVILGNHPELLALLMATNSAPNPYLGVQGPYFGMAKKASITRQPPYDHPLYARIAFHYPPGWELVSLKEMDKMIQHLDQVINNAISQAEWYTAYPTRYLGEPVRSNALALLTLSRFGSSEILPISKNQFQFPGLKTRDVADMLLDSVAMFQSFFWTLHPFQSLNSNQMGERILEIWITTGVANKLTGDLFGFSHTSPLERELISRTLISYALVATLINCFPEINIVNVLHSIAHNDRFALYTGIALAIIENHRQGEINALQTTIRELTKHLQQDDEQLQNIKMLQALLQQMINQIFQMLVQNANTQATRQSEQLKKDEPPTNL